MSESILVKTHVLCHQFVIPAAKKRKTSSTQISAAWHFSRCGNKTWTSYINIIESELPSSWTCTRTVVNSSRDWGQSPQKSQTGRRPAVGDWFILWMKRWPRLFPCGKHVRRDWLGRLLFFFIPFPRQAEKGQSWGKCSRIREIRPEKAKDNSLA